jgi:hypothetical protein
MGRHVLSVSPTDLYILYLYIVYCCTVALACKEEVNGRGAYLGYNLRI